MSKMTGRGKVTIPVEFRLDLGVKAGDKVLFEKKDGSIIIRKAEKKGTVEVLEDSTPFSKSANRMMKKSGMSGIKTCIDTNVFLNVIHRDPSFYPFSKKILSAIDRGIAGNVESGPADV